MPKIQEFNIGMYSNSDIVGVIEKEMMSNIKNMKYHGATITISSRWNQVKISNEDLEIFKKSPLAERLLYDKYKVDKKEKIDKYVKLKAKCDYCLYDVKSYLKLIENIDEFSYCGATTELQVFEKRYIKSNGYTRAIYRARAQEFSKIKC